MSLYLFLCLFSSVSLFFVCCVCLSVCFLVYVAVRFYKYLCACLLVDLVVCFIIVCLFLYLFLGVICLTRCLCSSS